MDMGWWIPAVTDDPGVNIPQIFGGHKPSITTYNSFFFLFLLVAQYTFIPNAWSLQLPKRESIQLIHTNRLG